MSFSQYVWHLGHLDICSSHKKNRKIDWECDEWQNDISLVFHIAIHHRKTANSDSMPDHQLADATIGDMCPCVSHTKRRTHKTEMDLNAYHINVQYNEHFASFCVEYIVKIPKTDRIELTTAFSIGTLNNLMFANHLRWRVFRLSFSISMPASSIIVSIQTRERNDLKAWTNTMHIYWKVFNHKLWFRRRHLLLIAGGDIHIVLLPFIHSVQRRFIHNVSIHELPQPFALHLLVSAFSVSYLGHSLYVAIAEWSHQTKQIQIQ